MSREVDPVLLEILRMTREIVINEYTDRRAELHNRWLADYEHSWRNYRVKIPSPSIPPYPTEVEIVDRAKVLFDFIMRDTPDIEQTVPKTVEPIIAPVVESIVEPVVERIVEPVTEVKPEPVPAVEEKISSQIPEQISGNILSTLFKKVEEVRTNWKKNE